MHKNGTASLEARFDAVKESMRNFVGAGGERASQFKSRAIDVKDAFVEGGSTALHKTGYFIRRHPFVAIGIAFGVGYIVMRVVKK